MTTYPPTIWRCCVLTDVPCQASEFEVDNYQLFFICCSVCHIRKVPSHLKRRREWTTPVIDETTPIVAGRGENYSGEGGVEIPISNHSGHLEPAEEPQNWDEWTLCGSFKAGDLIIVIFCSIFLAFAAFLVVKIVDLNNRHAKWKSDHGFT